MANIITRNNLSGLIPETVSREILQGAVAESAVLKMARRLPNMTSKTSSMPVLSMLPTSYWVNSEPSGSVATEGDFKKTSNMAWDKKIIHAEELAVIIPIPEAALDDADYDIWGEIKPRLYEAFGKKIDSAILFGIDKPATWREGIVPSAATAGNTVAAGSGKDVYDDLLGEDGLIAKVEEDGYEANGVVAAVGLRAKLRGLRDQNGQPIFKTDMQGATRYAIDGMDTYFPNNGAFDASRALAIAGDWGQMVYSIRQDMTFKIFDTGVIQNPTTGAIEYNLMQNDMVALRAVMRLGWEVANPVNAFNADNENAFPFSVYTPAGE